ncbi:armadillo-like helical domain-containing protein [Tanacetum coccineum]
MTCTKPTCFFCTMKEPNTLIRKSGIKRCFKEMLLVDEQERVLILSGLWHIAMNQTEDPEFPSLGIFKCMVNLLHKSINDKSWLLDGQNIYTPYYAAHIIGSYTMNKFEFAEIAVDSGVISPLIDLLRGKMSWVEQRVAVRALGHLASYDCTFEALAVYEEEVVTLTMGLASSCSEVVYKEFVSVKNADERVKYHKNLITRGVGGLETENRKAEEWASQIQCWSLHLLNCFAIRGRSIELICNQVFLEDLSSMWGGLVNHSSPSGVGLIRILCYTPTGRKKVSKCKEIIESICNLSRSSDDWQYMGIDCLLLLLQDMNTRYKVLETASIYLSDLIELRKLGERSKLGQKITKALLIDLKNGKSRFKNLEVDRILKEIWVSKVDKNRKERLMSDEKLEEKRVLVCLIKQQANHSFWLGDIETAVMKYTEGLNLCPSRLKKERIVLYSNRAQCYLLLNDPDTAISDTTRALSISKPVNSHAKSLWRRSQAYYMKGLSKESLMDCLMFINAFVGGDKKKHAKIPYYAVQMIKKLMDLTWFFASARSKLLNETSPSTDPGRSNEEVTNDDESLMSGKRVYFDFDDQKLHYLINL